MKKVLLFVGLLLVAGSLFAQTTVVGNITENTTWTLAGSPYVVNDPIEIPEGVTLTIEPGVVVKHDEGELGDYSTDPIKVFGTVLAQGTADQPIVFTHIRDDEFGGDTNNDGPLSSPILNDWQTFFVKPTSGATSIFSYCQFRYCGNSNINEIIDLSQYNEVNLLSANYGAIYCAGSSPTISNCQFFNCYIGITVKNEGHPIVIDNIFEQNINTPISISYDVTPDYANNTFINNNIDGLGLEKTSVIGNYTVAPTTVAGIENIPYVVHATLSIPEDVTLNLAPGTIIKFFSSNNDYPVFFYIHGTLLAEGMPEQPIVFTSLKDDEYGGDTNTDGLSQVGPSQWDNIIVTSDSDNSSIFSNCEFRGGGGENKGTLQCDGSSPTITNCHFYKCKTGLEVKNVGAPLVENNDFEQNSETPITIGPDVIPAYANNTYTNNGITGLGLRKPDFLNEGTHTIGPTNVAGIENIPYVVLDSYTSQIDINLTILPGVIVKFKGIFGGLNIHGQLIAEGTSEQPIIFTSLADDEHGGDTNMDGDASCPDQSIWQGIKVTDFGNGKFNHCVFRFGDYGLELRINAQVNNCVFDHNTWGLSIYTYGITLMDSCTFTQNERGVQLDGNDDGSATITNSTFYNNTDYDIYNYSTQPIYAINNWWGVEHTAQMLAVDAGEDFEFIYDQQDNPTKGLVTYYPPLSVKPELFTPSFTGFEYDRINNEIYFYNTSDPSSNYFWNFGDGSPIANLSNPTHEYETLGLYNVCLSADGCTYNCEQVVIPGISSLSPNQTGNDALYIAYLQGAFPLDPTAEIYLVQGGTTIAADTTVYLGETFLQINFTLEDAPLGTYNVIYSSSTMNDTLENALTIVSPTPYDFQTVIEGQANVLVNTWRTYKVEVQNGSNQTAFGVPVYVKVIGDTEVELLSATNPANLPTGFDEGCALFQGV